MPCDMRLRPPLSLNMTPDEVATAARLLKWGVSETDEAITITLPGGRVILIRKTTGQAEVEDRYQVWGINKVKDQLMQASAMVQMVDQLEQDGYSVMEHQLTDEGEVEMVLERY